jgi:hypothetical protein
MSSYIPLMPVQVNQATWERLIYESFELGQCYCLLWQNRQATTLDGECHWIGPDLHAEPERYYSRQLEYKVDYINHFLRPCRIFVAAEADTLVSYTRPEHHPTGTIMPETMVVPAAWSTTTIWQLLNMLSEAFILGRRSIQVGRHLRCRTQDFLFEGLDNHISPNQRILLTKDRMAANLKVINDTLALAQAELRISISRCSLQAIRDV